MQKAIQYSLIVLMFFLLLPIHTNAKISDENREDIFEFVKSAFQAQVALSEKDRTLAEVHELLTPYFSTSYMELFLKENLLEENNKYFTLGSDFALYYIPFFSYSNATKIVVQKDKIYVYEFFPGNQEGPVAYQDHYEGILLEAQNGQYKVAKLTDKVPETLDESKKPEEHNEKETKQNEQASFSLSLLFSRVTVKNPVDFYIEWRSYFK